MNSNEENIVTGSPVYYSFSNTAGNIGLPVNSRIINQSQTINQPYPNYHILNQPQSQQLYSPVATVPRQSIVYQNSLSPPTIQKVANSQVINFSQPANQTILGSSQGVRTRLVPVTQYVPVYELDNSQTVVNQSETLHQRVILHEPQAFKQRVQYDQHIEVMPTVIEQQKIYAAPPSSTSVKVVKVQRDPLVETVQGEWKSRVSNSRQSYVAATPLPRESKPCCSGWLLFLLALLALGGILTAILLGKAFSQQEVNGSGQTVVEGTKVRTAAPSIEAVKPLTNATVAVKGVTAVTTPISVTGATTKTSSPTKQQVLSIAPTDISVVSEPSITYPSQLGQTQPQQIGFVQVKPVIVNPLSYQQQSKVSSAPPLSVQPVSVAPIGLSPIRLNETQTANLVGSSKPTSLTFEAETIEPTIIKPSTIQPINIPEAVNSQARAVDSDLARVTYVSPIVRNQSLSLASNYSPMSVPAYEVPAVIVGK